MERYRLLRKLYVSRPHLPVLLMTAYGTVQQVVEGTCAMCRAITGKNLEPRALVGAWWPATRAGPAASWQADGAGAMEPSSQTVVATWPPSPASDSTVL